MVALKQLICNMRLPAMDLYRMASEVAAIETAETACEEVMLVGPEVFRMASETLADQKVGQ